MTTYKRIIETGGSDMCYVWHVHGYPWAVCTDSRLVELASEPSTDADAQFIRKKIFGDKTVGSYTPAYDARIFATLAKVGPQTVKAKELGLIDIGSWNLEIMDIHQGGNYGYLAAGDQLWGLDGLHRVADLNDSVHGWGFLSESLKPDADTVSIEDESETLYDRIATPGNYRLLWIGHECLAVTGVDSGNFPEYEATIGERGLFRSKKQHHFTSSLEGYSQIIQDVPSSIPHHFCTLWAIPLNNGEFFRDSSDNPIIAIERTGVVSPDIGTNAGVTSVRILSPLDSMLNEVSYDISKQINGHFAKYVFCRGSSGTNWGEIYNKGQKPHLILVEYDWDETNRFGRWNARPVWLCGKNSVVTFDTVEDLVSAVNTELGYLSTGNAAQSTGDGTANNERVTLSHRYEVTKEAIVISGETVVYNDPDDPTVGTTVYSYDSPDTNPMWYLRQITGGGDYTVSFVTGSFVPICGKWSQVGGSVQHVLGLGVPHFPDNWLLPTVLNSICNFEIGCLSNSDSYAYVRQYVDFDHWIPNESDGDLQYMSLRIYTSTNVSGEWVEGAGGMLHGMTVPAGLCQVPQILELKAPEDFYVSPYFHEWDWINYPSTYNPSMPERSMFDPAYTGGVMHLCVDYLDTPILQGYQVDGTTDLEQFPDGTEIKCGVFNGTLAYKIEADIDTRFIVLDGLNWTTDNESACAVGSCFICVPAFVISENQKPGDINDSWDPNEDDYFRLTINRTDRAEDASEIIRAFLGYSDTDLFVPIHERRYWIPFFRTDAEDGFVSQIDWDSLKAILSFPLKKSTVLVPKDSFNMKNALNAELQLYGAGMYEDWDSTNHQPIYRFRRFGDIVTSETISRGRVIGVNYLMPGSVAEDHLDLPTYNKIEISYKRTGDGKSFNVNVINEDVSSLIQREALTLGISLVFTTLSKDPDYFGKNPEPLMPVVQMLASLAKQRKTLKRSLIFSSRFKTTAGLEILITDPAARYPATHQIGLISAPALVTEQTRDPSTQQVKIAFLVSGDNAVHGYAPTCRCDVSEVDVQTDGFICDPDEHYSTSPYQAKDIYYFDCYDVSDPSSPQPITDNCDDYSVLVYAQSQPISANKPIPGTCRIVLDGSTHRLRVYCDESLLPASGKLIITYGKFDDCEDDQKDWLFFCNQYGTVGTVARRGDSWK